MRRRSGGRRWARGGIRTRSYLFALASWWPGDLGGRTLPPGVNGNPSQLVALDLSGRTLPPGVITLTLLTHTGRWVAQR